jgi:Na+-transporting NADH:ubiquinone oxidoreductase subunit C
MVDNALSGSPARALRVALGVALVCSLLVSVTAVTLRPFYTANLEKERIARLGSILAVLHDVTGEIGPKDIESRIVNLETGEYRDDIDPSTWDVRKATGDPQLSIAIPPEHDVAQIKRRAKDSVVYLVRKPDGGISAVILPVWGVGYQSALYGYLALSADLDEILALKFYEQNETPGLGSRIQDPAWETLWEGKKPFDESGSVAISVGGEGHGDRPGHVDGISGATRTSLGVNGMVRFWLGGFGFGAYLDRLRRGEG